MLTELTRKYQVSHILFNSLRKLNKNGQLGGGQGRSRVLESIYMGFNQLDWCTIILKTPLYMVKCNNISNPQEHIITISYIILIETEFDSLFKIKDFILLMYTSEM